MKGRWIVPSAISAASTDDADGTDGNVGICAIRPHLDHCTYLAFSGEPDLDAQGAQERPRRRTQPASTVDFERKRSDALPAQMVRSITAAAMGSASMMLSMAALRFAT